MKRLYTLLTAALLSLALIPAAHATTLLNYGTGMRDTSTNLLWLDLDQTNGLSPNAALAAFPNFRMATHGEVIAMFVTAGFDGQFETYSNTNFDAADTLINFLGSTTSFPTPSTQQFTGQGWANDGAVFREPFYQTISPNAQAPLGRFFSGNSFSNSGTIAFAGVGTFLVAQVPLPATLPLLISALALFGFGLRRQRRGAYPA